MSNDPNMADFFEAQDERADDEAADRAEAAADPNRVLCPTCKSDDLFTGYEQVIWTEYDVELIRDPDGSIEIEEDELHGQEADEAEFEPERYDGLSTNHDGRGERVITCRDCRTAFTVPSLQIVTAGTVPE